MKHFCPDMWGTCWNSSQNCVTCAGCVPIPPASVGTAARIVLPVQVVSRHVRHLLEQLPELCDRCRLCPDMWGTCWNSCQNCETGAGCVPTCEAPVGTAARIVWSVQVVSPHVGHLLDLRAMISDYTRLDKNIGDIGCGPRPAKLKPPPDDSEETTPADGNGCS